MHNHETVAVLGATGYVGRVLCQYLRAAGRDIVAIVRDQRAFMLSGTGVPTITPEAARLRKFSTVVNLAYPTQGKDYTYRAQNLEIFKTLNSLVQPTGLVIHASTLVVFGTHLEAEVREGPVKQRRDSAYVECKIEMEHMLEERLSRGCFVEIVRFGNVWGPGSPLWVANIARCIVEGFPLGVVGLDGFANITDVANICNYINVLIENRTGSRGIAYHHLSEFGGIRWSHLVNFIGETLQLPVVRVRSITPSTSDLVGEAKQILGSVGYGAGLKAAYRSRVIGSFCRSIVGRLPARVLKDVESRAKQAIGSGRRPVENEALLRQITCEKSFPLIVRTGWTPDIDIGESKKRVATWLKSAGYIAE